MKKNIIILSLVLIIGAGGCEDPLDITPNGRISLSDVFTDSDQTAAYLNSCYAYLQQYGGNYNFHTMLAAFTDEAHDSNDGQGPAEWANGGLTPTSNPISADGWNGNYYEAAWTGIRKCNVFLANIDEATVDNNSKRARWKAEAKVLRAFYYWDLIMRHGPMPVVETPFALDTDFAVLTRPAFDESVQFIVRDCNEAIAESELPWRISSGEGDRGRFTKAVAYAIKSQALLFNASPLWNPSNDKGKWQAAATAAEEAIKALTETSNYDLFPEYGKFFITTPDMSASPIDRETILEMKRNGNISQWQFMSGIPSVQAYKAGDCPSQELVDSYEMADGSIPILGYNDDKHLNPIINPLSGYDESNPYVNRDPRFYETVYFNGAYYGDIHGGPYYVQSYVGGADGYLITDSHYTHTGYYQAKFINGTLTGSQSSGARYRKFRLAEIYLNLAEAENEANGPTDIAYTAVNIIRARANMPPLEGLTQDQFRDRVRNERRVELAYEEHRFWDVRRWKILGETDRVITGMVWVKNGEDLSNSRVVVEERKSYEPKFRIFPIPLGDIAVLPNFEQNPGW